MADETRDAVGDIWNMGENDRDATDDMCAGGVQYGQLTETTPTRMIQG